MKKHTILSVLMVLLSFLMAGCGKKLMEVDLEHLQNEAGEYQYGNLVWGSNKAGVESALDITFEQSDHEVNQIRSYIVQDAYSLNGLPAIVTCEFDTADMCNAVQFRVSPTAEEANAFWENLATTLTSLYGSTDPVSYDTTLQDNPLLGTTPISTHSESYLWEHSDATIRTALSISKVSVNHNTPSIVLSVYIIPEDKP